MLRDETGSTFTEGVLAGEIKVPTEQELTFYARHGELFAKACAAITLVSIFVRFRHTCVGDAVYRGVRRGANAERRRRLTQSPLPRLAEIFAV